MTARVDQKPHIEQGSGVPGLCRAIIAQAFFDAAWTGARSLDDVPIWQKRMAHIRGEALVWLRGDSDDFAKVCDRADVDPSFVRALARGTFGSYLDDLYLPAVSLPSMSEVAN